MLFSLSSTALSAENKSITTENYTEIINEKVKSENFFIKFIAKLIILGVKLRLISIDKLNEWYDPNTPEIENTPNDTPALPTPDEETAIDNILKLHPSQSLPYISNEIIITDIIITKEKYDGIRYISYYPQVQKYRYNIKIMGYAPNINLYNYSIEIQYLSSIKDGSELRYYPFKDMSESNIDSTLIVDENGHFELDCSQYNMFFDYDTYYISLIDYMW
jgi:hypothetical protein